MTRYLIAAHWPEALLAAYAIGITAFAICIGVPLR